MWRDIVQAIRRSAKQKLFSISIILLVAIGIGSNTVIFSLVNSLLLRPLPVSHPENLYLIQQMRTRQVRPETGFFYRQFEATQGQKQIFSQAVAEQSWGDNSFQALALSDGVHLVSTQIVSPNYFSELGVKAIVGRVLDEVDANSHGVVPVVISEQCWTQTFRKSSDILNREIRIRNLPFVVVGVLPQGFHGIDADRVPDIRLPISAASLLTGSSIAEPGGDYPLRFQILARLAPGVSAAAASSAITPVLTQMEEELWTAWYERSPQPIPAAHLRDQIDYWRSYRVSLLGAERGVSRLREQFSSAAALLMRAGLLLLLVVCANLAGLVLAKSAERQYEIGVRSSLGASRWRLVQQIYTENLLLAVPGAAIGLVMALLVSPQLLKFLPTLGIGAYAPPTALDLQPDLRVFAFASLTSLATVAFFGFAPVWRAWRHDFTRHLASGGRSVSNPSTSGAIAIQIALTALLVTASLLIFKTFWKLNHLDPGFDQDHVIEAVVDPWDAGFSKPEATALLTRVQQKAAQIPGVRAVSFAGGELMRGIGMKTTVVPAGRRLSAGTFLNTSANRVTPNYFDSLGIPLFAGRSLNWQDIEAKPIHIVVNRAFADSFFPRQNPIGQAIVQGTDGFKAPTAVIVGVVGTAKYRSLREIDPPIYYSASDVGHAGGVIYLRAQGDPAPVIRAMRGLLRELAPTLPLATIFTLRQEVEASLWQERLITLLCAFFACSALLLSGIGIYSAVAYSVAQRRRELGIRMALGARKADIIRTVSSRLSLAVALGLAGGLCASAVVSQLIKGFLFQVDPLDGEAFSFGALILLVCCIAAGIVPTRRAIKIEPATALKQE